MKPSYTDGGFPPPQPQPFPYAPPGNTPTLESVPQAYQSSSVYPPPDGSQFPTGPYPAAPISEGLHGFGPTYNSYGPGPAAQGHYGPGPIPQAQYGPGPVPQAHYGPVPFAQGAYGPGPGHRGPPAVNWMPRPVVLDCPPGLEYLTQINQLLVKQKKELFEIMTDIETANRYVIVNTMGQTVIKMKAALSVLFARDVIDYFPDSVVQILTLSIFLLHTESNFCARQCCRSQRPYTMHVQDNSGMEVIRVKRPYKCYCCWECLSCSECCQDELQVEAPIGQLVGYVKQIQDGCNIRYAIKDSTGKQVLRIHGPSYCHCACFGEDINFKVMSADGNTEVGRITKQWSNIVQEMFTDADNFGIAFPMDLDVRIKATLIGAVFLIDFMFFEDNQPHRSDD
ncbi:Scramblase, partial [Opisthorchis viverrini]